MYLGVADFPGWISQSCNVVDLMYIQTQFATSVCLDLPPNPPHNFLGMILCFKPGHNGSSVFKITVKNTEGDVIWYKYNLFGFSTPNHSMMVVVPTSVFSVRAGDSTIELAANAAVLGFHLLYKKDIV
ncbi:hypothetical protein POM88_013870 [Heracleum sosnowskyi]|uniref:Uncharacterized protein n=1 Tax=Heracleum sosnowskyi TaxID=360622 RepID=A0AAD8J0Y6_9APIA|nr:hypothetical protein POM88_013870 [Heracleum sosnowskyi]